MKTCMKITAALAICVLIVLGSLYYWLQSSKYESTDDAYVDANIVNIAPRITGHITHVFVSHNESVKKGQLLFSIDKAPFTIALAESEQKLKQDQSSLENAMANFNRNKTLLKNDYVSKQQVQLYETQVKKLTAQVNLDNLAIKAKKLNLNYTEVTAPTAGWVTNIQLLPGDEVDQNQSLFAIVSSEKTWVVANFKETQIANIKPGQSVIINSDSYPDHVFHGFVESLSHGTGNAFALIPSENSSGNWVKVVQRLPVRIRVIQDNLPLRVGTSAEVNIMIENKK